MEYSQNFIIVPVEGQKHNLEFQTYSSLVAKELEALGYKETKELKKADYGVAFNYGVGGQKIVSHGDDTNTVYDRFFNLHILDLKNESKVFEVKVESSGTGNSFLSVHECLIKSVFKNFPGENAKTYRDVCLH